MKWRKWYDFLSLRLMTCGLGPLRDWEVGSLSSLMYFVSPTATRGI